METILNLLMEIKYHVKTLFYSTSSSAEMAQVDELPQQLLQVLFGALLGIDLMAYL